MPRAASKPRKLQRIGIRRQPENRFEHWWRSEHYRPITEEKARREAEAAAAMAREVLGRVDARERLPALVE